MRESSEPVLVHVSGRNVVAFPGVLLRRRLTFPGPRTLADSMREIEANERRIKFERAKQVRDRVAKTSTEVLVTTARPRTRRSAREIYDHYFRSQHGDKDWDEITKFHRNIYRTIFAGGGSLRVLTEWEEGFLQSIARKKYWSYCTEKQQALVDRLVEKVYNDGRRP